VRGFGDAFDPSTSSIIRMKTSINNKSWRCPQ
jgi:hypothetical protein